MFSDTLAIALDLTTQDETFSVTGASITGFSASAATSRMMWMASASRRSRWVSRIMWQLSFRWVRVQHYIG